MPAVWGLPGMAKLLPTVTGSCAKNTPPHHLPLQPLQRGQPSAAHRHLRRQSLNPLLAVGRH